MNDKQYSYISAMVMLLRGVVFAGMCVWESYTISESVLAYVAQVLIYSASVFGITSYFVNRDRIYRQGLTNDPKKGGNKNGN